MHGKRNQSSRAKYIAREKKRSPRRTGTSVVTVLLVWRSRLELVNEINFTAVFVGVIGIRDNRAPVCLRKRVVTLYIKNA